MIEYLENFVRRAERSHLRVEGIAAADGEKLLWQHRFTADIPRNIYSHTKSYTATAVGLAVSEGLVDLDDRLADYFPEKLPENPDPALGEIRLRHLLTMSSGFGRPYLMNENRRRGDGMPDYVRYMLSQKVRNKPGETFVYSSADSILAGRMVEKKAGVLLSEYLYRRIFAPLGQGFPMWECCPQGHPNGGGGMVMRLTDMMKLGQLYLAGGKWQGAQLLDPAWVKEAGSRKIATPADSIWSVGYGYYFWMLPYPDACRADGAYGQVTAILPKAGIAVAVQCPEDGDFAAVREALHEEVFSRL
ncbi:MAG TPA: serine hydrolase [Candidatus Merdivicinus intestinavium]|nr:serine hydrolase [Candidatus Merdivicinus intestinavium]